MDKNKLSDRNLSLEARLSAIALRDVSEEAMRHYDDTIDEMSSGISTEPLSMVGKNVSSRKRRNPWVWTSAAAITLMVTGWISGFWTTNDRSAYSLSQLSLAKQDTSSFTLLKSVNRVDAFEDDGLIIPEDGGKPHFRRRYHIVDEDQVRDDETGTIVTLRHPRQEVVTTPITLF